MSTFSSVRGHYLNTTWANASDTTARRVGKVVEYIILAENEYQELLQLWTYHGNDDQAVADQLFQDEFEGGATQASALQVQMAVDLKNAMIAVHNAHDSFDFAAARRMT